MSMTREEAIELLRDTPIDIRSTREDDIHTLYATAQMMAIDALLPVSRERIEKVWSGCYMCDEYRYFMFNAWKDPNSSKRPDCMGTSMFCPNCGRPLTDEALEMVMERLEALNENRG